MNGLNQYTGVGGDSFTYDVKGNLTSDGYTTYRYDTENRLLTATGADNATLTYDPNGRMVKLVSGGNSTRFVYDGDALIAEYNGSGSLTKRYLHGSGIDAPLVMFDGATVSDASLQYLHSDYQGSIVALSDSNNLLTGINTYDVYGIAHSDNQGRFAYTGQLALPEIGMYYYKARIYHPKLGRFLQTDPIGYEDGMNMYAYVGNDPVNMVDPTGEVGVPGFIIGAGLDIAIQLATGTNLSDIDYVQAGVAGVAGAVGAGIASAASKLASVAKFGKAATMATNAAGNVASSIAGTKITGGELSVAGVAANIAGGKALSEVGGAVGARLPASAKNITSQMKAKGSPNSRKGNRKLNRQANAQIRQTKSSRAATGAAIGSGAGGRAAGCLTADKC
ncbi:MAG: RHS repeat-associated core domain-containing protein [Alteromonadaceae bacterium]|nr:RHS repeat-associated core domain-containing protein [Alteromonadaceae bacterium]